MNTARRQFLEQGLALGGLCLSASMLTPNALAQNGGRFVDIDSFTSQYIKARKVRIWLPPDYDESKSYATLYMHDGQNLFDPADSFAYGAWEVDRHLIELRKKQEIRPCIVVAIWNGQADRSREYGPQAPIETLSPQLQARIPRPGSGGQTSPQADAYVRFLAEELVPYIDSHFATRKEAAQRFLMGSSMGGLISLYTLAKYPELFGGAACLSIHWIIATNPELTTPPQHQELDLIALSYRDWLIKHLPEAGRHRIYFDHGDKGLDALYGKHQVEVDALMRKKHYQLGIDWSTRYFPGTDHNEREWRARLADPLRFLLK